MKWRCARNSHPEASILFVTESERHRLTEKAWTVRKASLATNARWKISSCDYRHHPVCRGYKSGNRCIHGSRCLCRQADGKSKPSARSKDKYSRISCDPERKKKRPRLCIKTQRQWILFYGKFKILDWTRRRGTPEILRMHLVQSWIREIKNQSGGIIQKGEPHERNPCAPGFEEQPFEETSRQAICASKIAWNLARKYASSKPKTATFYPPVKASKTQKIECLLWIRELQCTMLSKGDLSSDTMDTLTRFKSTWATYRDWCSANKTSKHKFLFIISICSQQCNYSMKSQRFYCFIHFAWNADIHMSGKRRNSTIDPKWEDDYLCNGQLCSSRCIKTVIIFQQHFVFNIEMKGSV